MKMGKGLHANAAAFVRSIDRADILLTNEVVNETLTELRVTNPNHASAFRAVCHAVSKPGVLVLVGIVSKGQVDTIHFIRALLPPETIDAAKTLEAVKAFAAGKGPMLIELTNGSAIQFGM